MSTTPEHELARLAEARDGAALAEEVRRLGHQAVELIAAYLAGVEAGPVSDPSDPDALEAAFSGPLPEAPALAAGVLDRIRRDVVPHSMNVTHPRYFGLMNPAPTVMGIFADAVASALNQNCAAWLHAPAATHVEKQVIRWLTDAAGYGAEAFGILLSGGSAANVVGLHLARNLRGPAGLRDGGLSLASGPLTAYVSDQMHYSFFKAADMLGLGRDGLRRVPARGDLRADVEAMARRIAADRAAGAVPVAVIGIAGTTASGVIDPLPELADLAARERVWFHVDAAYAGALLLSSQRGKLGGIERADSITLDPHKWLYIPNDAGAILVRRGPDLRSVYGTEAGYLREQIEGGARVNFFQYGPEGSRRFRALKIWASLTHAGAATYRAWIDHDLEMASYLEEHARRSEDLELMAPRDTAIVCLRYAPPSAVAPVADQAGAARQDARLDAIQSSIQERIQREGKAWLSTVVLGGRRALRANIENYRTRREDVDLLLALIRRHGAEAAADVAT